MDDTNTMGIIQPHNRCGKSNIDYKNTVLPVVAEITQDKKPCLFHATSIFPLPLEEIL